jgi:hypothetical protein
MSGTTTQRQGLEGMAAFDVSRVHGVYVAANELMGKGSWSIPCTAAATFHKPWPRRQVISS